VSVVSGHQRADLVLPGTVPVVELLPELAERVGLLDPVAAPSGHRLRTADGQELAGAIGLTAQGVGDGTLLMLSAVDEPPPRVHDDLVAVVADTVEHDLVHRTAGAVRRTALAGAGVLLSLSALGLATAGGPGAAVVAGGVAAGLLGVAAGLVGRAPPAGHVLGWLGVVHAAVGGMLVAGAPGATAVAGAAAGALLAGGFGVVLVDRHVLLPAAIAGAVVALAALASLTADVALAVTLAVTFAAVVTAGDLLPWLAATVSGLGTGPPLDTLPPPRGVDRAAVGRGVRRAHALLAGLIGAQGLLVAVTVPGLVWLGGWGVAAAAAGCALLLLRARRHRVAVTALLAHCSWLGGAVAGAAATWCWHQDWRLWSALAVAVAGLGVVAAAMTPSAGSLRLARWAEVAEGLALVALPPLLVTATGVVDSVQELVP
jgi:type VII secretion integral membrane protein EccD